MPWDGEDRRKRITNTSGQHRRRGDLREAWGRIEGTEDDVDSVHTLITGLIETVRVLSEKVGELRGELRSVYDLCRGIDGNTRPPSRLEKTLTLLVPIIIACLSVLGAYFALKSQVSQVTKGP